MQVFTTVRNNWHKASTYLILLALWEGLAQLYPPVILPGPRETVADIARAR
ncbi:hypothetical protein [Brevibacillus sp. NRS-1366]|uniref:hypothetical protein n=1 Tax=Brevibacillus sp. NRS-1366 TaxID=3233899 RepID=UPI003D221333